MKDRMLMVPARLIESAMASARATRNYPLAEELRQLLCFEQESHSRSCQCPQPPRTR